MESFSYDIYVRVFVSYFHNIFCLSLSGVLLTIAVKERVLLSAAAILLFTFYKNMTSTKIKYFTKVLSVTTQNFKPSCCVWSSKLAEAVRFLICVRPFRISGETMTNVAEVFRQIPEQILTIRLRPLPSTTIPIHKSLPSYHSSLPI